MYMNLYFLTGTELESLIKLCPTSYIKEVSTPSSGGTEEKERSNLFSSLYIICEDRPAVILTVVTHEL